MAEDVCESCKLTWSAALFESCLVSSSVFKLHSVITYGCIAQLLAFIRNKQFDVYQPCASNSDPCYRAFSNVLQRIAILSVDVHRILKDKIPEIRSVTQSIKSIQKKCPTGWCCLPANIVYAKGEQPLSGAERSKRFRQNALYRQGEKMRMENKRADPNYQQSEKARLKGKRADPDYRQIDAERRQADRTDAAYQQSEKARLKNKRADPDYRQTEKARLKGKRADPDYRQTEAERRQDRCRLSTV